MSWDANVIEGMAGAFAGYLGWTFTKRLARRRQLVAGIVTLAAMLTGLLLARWFVTPALQQRRARSGSPVTSGGDAT